MATKKKKITAKKKSATKPKVTAKRPERLAVKVLGTLPPLSELRRRAYRAAFSEAQCEEWGARTKAVAVLADAERAVGAVQAAVKKGVDGYSPYRLAWLCSQMIDLQDALGRQQATDGSQVRAGRDAAVAIASRTRQKLAHGLEAVAFGNDELRRLVADRNESSETPAVLEASITGLLQLALKVRRSQEGEVLADDAGLSEAFLSSASAVVDSLRTSNEATYGTGTRTDSPATNRVEGRVLRELSFLRQALEHARARGVVVPAFPGLSTLQHFARPGAAAPPAPPPAPPAMPAPQAVAQ